MAETEQKEKNNNDTSRFKWVVEVAELANFMGVTVMTISNWNKSGMPKLERGKYNLKDCWRWWLKNIYMPKESTKKATGDHERFMAAKADNEEIKRDKWREILILKDKVIAEFAGRAADLKTTLRAFRYRLAPVLEGKTSEEIALLIGGEVDRLLENFCRNGKYIETPAASAAKPTTAKKKPAKKKRKK